MENIVMQQKETSFNADLLRLSHPLKIIIKNETASTNTDAKLLGESKSDDALIIAFKQTGGKGRLNRSFFSPEDTGIYMSLLLHPQLSAEDSLFLTTAAAVATAKAAEKASGKKALIKWVNDIYIDNKKVCGILSNAVFHKSTFPDYVIIGIGINLNTPKNGFPEELKEIATSLFKEEQVSNIMKAELISDIVNNIMFFLNSKDLKAHLKEYKERSMLTGKTVYYNKDGKDIVALVTGIDDNCRLLLKTQDGKDISLFAGEVSVKQSQ